METMSSLPRANARTYDGARENPLLWLDHIDRILTYHTLTTPKRLSYASSLLRGPAEVWLSTCTSEYVNNWENFRGALIKRFRSLCFGEEIEHKQRNVKMDSKENVSGYTESFCYLHKLVPDIGGLYRFNKYWIWGLKGGYPRQVMMKTPSTYEAAVEMAVALEQAHSFLNNDFDRELECLPGAPRNEGDLADIMYQVAALARRATPATRHHHQDSRSNSFTREKARPVSAARWSSESSQERLVYSKKKVRKYRKYPKVWSTELLIRYTLGQDLIRSQLT